LNYASFKINKSMKYVSKYRLLEYEERDLEQMVFSSQVEARVEAARRTKNPNVLDKLSDDWNSRVLFAVAQNPVAPATALENLTQFPFVSVLMRVGDHPNSPESLLDKLSDHEEPGVRASVAGNPRTSFPTLAKLAKDQAFDVSAKAESNPTYQEGRDLLGDWGIV
jgi:hypothetical protein